MLHGVGSRSKEILKARGTFKKALDHIDQIPEFTFAQPLPCYYQWMKDYFPHIYTRMKAAVAAGRFIPLGGSWVESDTNIPWGESLVRQRLYGQRFYLKNSALCRIPKCFKIALDLTGIFPDL